MSSSPALAALLGGALCVSSLAVEPYCPAVLAGIAAIRSQLERNDFIVDRPLHEYDDRHGSDFTGDIDALTPDDTWYDMGGSRVAVADYFDLVGPRGANVRLLWYRRPPDGVASARLAPFEASGRLAYLEGYAEELDLTRSPRARLITDYFGPMTYTWRLSELLRVYGRLLAAGGNAYIALPASTRIAVPGGELTLAEFLRTRCRGLSVVSERARGTMRLVRLRRNDEPLVIPDLFLRFLVVDPDGGEPLRTFSTEPPTTEELSTPAPRPPQRRVRGVIT